MAGPGFSWITYLLSKVLHDVTSSTMTTLQPVKFSLEQAMKAQGVVEVKLYSFFNLGVRRGWVVNPTPCPGRFTPGKESRYPLYNATGHSKVAK